MKINGKELSDLIIELDRQHFSYLRGTSNINVDTDEFMSRLYEFATKNKIFGLTTGIQGVGKTTTMKKYFPEDMVVSVDDLARHYKETRTKKDLEEALEYMEFTGVIFPDWRAFGLEDWLDKKLEEIIDEKLGNENSLILDGIYPNSLIRQEKVKKAEEYNPYKIDFLFVAPLHVVIERIKRRKKYDKRKNVSPLDLYRYLINFEQPVDFDTGLPEDGLDLVIVFNDGKITHVYPKEELEKFDY